MPIPPTDPSVAPVRASQGQLVAGVYPASAELGDFDLGDDELGSLDNLNPRLIPKINNTDSRR